MPIAFAQNAAPIASATTRAKPLAFEVVSIGLDKAPPSAAVFDQDGPAADGYRSHQSLGFPLLTAYVPQTGGAAMYSFNQIKGLPDWISDRYDIEARIADADRAEWQNPASRKVMLQSMLQSLLADRCKLVVHRAVKETQVKTLIVAKGGPKLKETDPAAQLPPGNKLPWGGVLVSHPDGLYFYDTSMASFASFLANLVNQGQPVQDKTGLTDRYDFAIKSIPQDSPAGGDASESPLATEVFSALPALGLKFASEKGHVETLVIDHIVRPSQN